MTQIITILLGICMIAVGAIDYIVSHQLVKTRTEIITVHVDASEKVTRVFKDGAWNESLEWLKI